MKTYENKHILKDTDKNAFLLLLFSRLPLDVISKQLSLPIKHASKNLVTKYGTLKDTV